MPKLSTAQLNYLYDYRFGLRWLFFLSLTHMFLEFPLNHLTFFNIGKELKGLATPFIPTRSVQGG